MKSLNDICLVIQARLGSTRVPGKVIKPFAGTTLFDIALKKAQESIVPNENIFAAVHEPELREIVSKYTTKGSSVIRFYGESNGYYSESVTVEVVDSGQLKQKSTTW